MFAVEPVWSCSLCHCMAHVQCFVDRHAGCFSKSTRSALKGQVASLELEYLNETGAFQMPSSPRAKGIKALQWDGAVPQQAVEQQPQLGSAAKAGRSDRTDSISTPGGVVGDPTACFSQKSDGDSKEGSQHGGSSRKKSKKTKSGVPLPGDLAAVLGTSVGYGPGAGAAQGQSGSTSGHSSESGPAQQAQSQQPGHRKCSSLPDIQQQHNSPDVKAQRVSSGSACASPALKAVQLQSPAIQPSVQPDDMSLLSPGAYGAHPLDICRLGPAAKMALPCTAVKVNVNNSGSNQGSAAKPQSSPPNSSSSDKGNNTSAGKRSKGTKGSKLLKRPQWWPKSEPQKWRDFSISRFYVYPRTVLELCS